MLEQLQHSLSSDSPTLIMAVAALAVLTLFWGLASIIGRRLDPARRRLRQIASEGDELPSDGVGHIVSGLLQPVERFVLPKGSEREGTRQRLQYAGYRSTSAVTTFYGMKLALAALLLLAWSVAASFLPKLTWGRITFIGLALCFFGMLLPSLWLDRKVKTRHKLLRDGFPDALDLLNVCVESGLGLAQALQRVADELDVSHPELASEIAQVTAQMRAGVDRETALRGLATRTGLDDVRGLVSLLAQTLRFGTGISDALRVYSEEFRDKRMQRAEEAAAKIGTKLIFPLVICLFPSFFVVAIGPAMIRLSEAFGGAIK
ncbi:MAG: type II secretion system F family protein [Steroidobacteraceae bacterium]